MKGKIILIPLKEPKEGMKVVVNGRIGYITLIEEHTFVIEKKPSNNKTEDFILQSSRNCSVTPELQQIAVEYNKGTYRFIGNIKNQPVIDILPLYPDDYETALPLIGKEVEFEDVPICENCGVEYCDNGNCKGIPDWHFAKLITPTPVMYTEEEVRIICMNARGNFNKTDDKFDDWWNENKKK